MQGKTCAIFYGVASRSWRENVMAVCTLLHYALEIPDLSAGERFYRDFGLADMSTRDEAVHLRPAQLLRESVMLYPGPKKRLHHLAFGAPSDNYAQVREAIQRAGLCDEGPHGCAAHARVRLGTGMGFGTARHRLELLLLHPRSLRELCRVFLRSGSHSGELSLGAPRFPGAGCPASLGSRAPSGFRRE
jgi:hypothetical protein